LLKYVKRKSGGLSESFYSFLLRRSRPREKERRKSQVARERKRLSKGKFIMSAGWKKKKATPGNKGRRRRRRGGLHSRKTFIWDGRGEDHAREGGKPLGDVFRGVPLQTGEFDRRKGYYMSLGINNT